MRVSGCRRTEWIIRTAEEGDFEAVCPLEGRLMAGDGKTHVRGASEERSCGDI
ncbi:MAG: hypothetical protein Q4F18_09205 [Clostridia bacterium]|nr:hypothetical protein [Clostridia bacterium]